MSRHLRVQLSIFGLFLAFSVGSQASAQSDEELARARGLFAEGIEHSEGGRYAEAAAAFRQVLEVRDSPAVRYNLALNLYELGQVREADENVQLVLSDSETPAAVRSDAADLRLHIEETGGRLTVRIQGAPVGTYEVTLDGRAVANMQLGTPLRVGAGEHAIEVTRGEESIASRTVAVTVGASESVEIPIAPTAVETAETVVSDPVIVDEDEGSGGGVATKWQFWVVVGAVLVTGAAVAAIVAFSQPEDEAGPPYVGNFTPGVITFE